MDAGSKDFYDAMKMFETSVKSMDNFCFDKPTFEQKQSLPPGEWYNHGETNKAFHVFLAGVEYGRLLENY